MAGRAAIILAAGISSRMKTNTPKVLHEVCGRPMLAYVLDACRGAGVEKIYVVVGFGAELVKKKFEADGDVVWVRQEQQQGTAHAVLCCKEHLNGFDGETLVLCGDGPLIRAETLRKIIKKHEAEKTAATLATAILEDPTGYGRVCRGADGNITAIVEHNDCTSEQLKIKEVNPSYYVFDNRLLFKAAVKVKPNNAKKEYYLTDAISIIIAGGHKVAAIAALSPEEAKSVNTNEQLQEISRIMESRLSKKVNKDVKVKAGKQCH
ncbi:MAG: NTP transferase domain-containing protein [Phycisphaerae bacterium]|jgi:bifunctional UDP-N-acetylglucosamine pyrophosphorylase/glucosamine-1-phosphate N-acetyltransferase